ncbi:carbohydrate ABC transporter membrane protein 1 (CUT1 family) [Aliiruegeria haliotis]|uniref:Carbohydrate ABC transporter membrane protein 1 (CUT1 family) n=1 Tax=Aliiruegeria haliotis TaxID=1280846 RepID=A0A2T0RLX5_9RHOB|nr:sugar ABC transporter permease [Aliiruegeria haliotis]PRY22122.1 carbohydrate ABC transporter membrane protein 1 (CUT1 family) [Aliiruegeria haliotis]
MTASTQPATVATPPRKERDHANPRSAIATFLFPALLIYAAFTALPVMRTIYNSTHLIVPNKPAEWVGFTHYIELWNDNIFWKAVGNTLTWATVAPLMEVSIATILALALYAKVPFSRFLRVAWFTPVLMSYVVVGILWMWIYNYDWGAVNSFLRWIGLDGWAQPWLGHPDTALPALIAVTTWMWTGFNMVVILAAMSSLPSEVLEAAELDNCGWFGKLWFVILPLIRPTLLNLIVLSFIGKMKIFDLVWVTTQGNPLWATETVSTYVYKRAFQWSTFDLGYPSTIAVVWFVIVMAGVLALTRLFRQKDKLEY